MGEHIAEAYFDLLPWQSVETDLVGLAEGQQES